MSRLQDPRPVSGIYAALLTPRKAGTSDADAAAFLEYLDRTVAAGVDGVVLFGATGEFIHFDLAERVRCASLAVRRSRVPALVNISHSTMLGTIALAESAMKVGAAGVMLMPPYFYRHSDPDLFAFYREMTEIIEGEVPLFLYNLPAFTNPLSGTLIERLLSLPGIAGIKDSSGDPILLAQLQKMRAQTDFRLLSGNENLYVSARTHGADGAVSGIAAALPELMVALDRAIVALDSARVLQLQARLSEFMHWVSDLPPVAAIQETAVFRGWARREPVLPQSEDTKARIEQLHRWLATWLPCLLTETTPAAAR